jgi:GT2 family glycosyltransferase
MKQVAAIVVTYNRKQLLLENISCLLQQTTRQDLDIIIIDNASTDGTNVALQPLLDKKELVYINMGSNLGGAGGFQFGIKYAAEHDYTYIWVMDDDCMPTTMALEEFLRQDRILKKNYGYLSSQVKWRDDSICTMNIQRKTVFKNVEDFKSDLVPIKMASFVSLFIPTKTVLQLGLPIKEFFIWTDDWEYTRRISKHYPCYLANKSIVKHKSNSNIGANIANDTPARLNRYRYLYRNDVYLYKREGLEGFLYEFLRLSYHALKVIFTAPDNKVQRLLFIYNGTKDGLSFDPKIEFAKNHQERTVL